MFQTICKMTRMRLGLHLSFANISSNYAHFGATSDSSYLMKDDVFFCETKHDFSFRTTIKTILSWGLTHHRQLQWLIANFHRYKTILHRFCPSFEQFTLLFDSLPLINVTFSDSFLLSLITERVATLLDVLVVGNVTYVSSTSDLLKAFLAFCASVRSTFMSSCRFKILK